LVINVFQRLQKMGIILDFVKMKTVKHNTKSSKGQRLGWTSVKKSAEVRLTADMMRSRTVSVDMGTADKKASSGNLLVP
jgi:hypothetical protein